MYNNIVVKEILIFGSGGHAKVILHEILSLKKYKFVGFVDQVKSLTSIIVNKKKYKIYPENHISKFKRVLAIIGVGDNNQRYKIFNNMKKNKNVKWETIISKNSILQEGIMIGDGSFIMAGSIINSNSKIGNHCIINTGSILEHDNVASFSSIAPGLVPFEMLKLVDVSIGLVL